MKKILILACGALFFATSCLSGGGSAGSSSKTYEGVLTVSDIATGEVTYSNKNASVEVWIPNIIEPKIDFIFNSVKFDSAMPIALNIEIAGVPFTSTISEDETTINYVFKGENIIPMAGGTPYEKYKVGIIEGYVGRVVEIRFDVTSKDKRVHFTTAKSEEE